MPKINEKSHIIHLRKSAVIDQPMVLMPLDEYEELLEDAEVAKSKSLTDEIEKARINFKKGKGRLLEDVISVIEGRSAR